ncbi:MAG TPA: hypothetical protein VK791_01410 [bacterium]|jgi:hypothetical protein|nr:hypothetical protein [bacterium]
MKQLLRFVAALAIFAGCASTRFHDISTRIDPATHYHNIIVHSDLADPVGRKTAEDAVVKEIQLIGINATASYTVFPPEANYTWDQKKQMIQADGFDAGVLVQIVQSFSTTTTQMFINHNVVDISTAHFKIQTKIVETSDFEVVWQAQSGSRVAIDDYGKFDFANVMSSYGSALVNELQLENVLVGTTKP